MKDDLAREDANARARGAAEPTEPRSGEASAEKRASLTIVGGRTLRRASAWVLPAAALFLLLSVLFLASKPIARVMGFGELAVEDRGTLSSWKSAAEIEESATDPGMFTAEGDWELEASETRVRFLLKEARRYLDQGRALEAIRYGLLVLDSEPDNFQAKQLVDVAEKTLARRRRTPTSKPVLPKLGRRAVYDPLTGLAWQAQDNGGDIGWHDADVYCRDLELDELHDWRLPSIGELATLYDGFATDELRTRLGIRLSACCVWSSTAGAEGRALYLYFLSGETGEEERSARNLQRVLCTSDGG